ncbi:MAG TPA: hypothetical protein VJN88_15530 [Ktedonobacterales bacterium]|nr:hypothetical protein [Ktedonobacterales bacterium]
MTTDERDREPGEVGTPRADDAPAVICPFCKSPRTERFALFGSRLSTDHYVCRDCHTPFERMRHTGQ